VEWAVTGCRVPATTLLIRPTNGLEETLCMTKNMSQKEKKKRGVGG
jgi:hypothetical protein